MKMQTKTRLRQLACCPILVPKPLLSCFGQLRNPATLKNGKLLS